MAKERRQGGDRRARGGRSAIPEAIPSGVTSQGWTLFAHPLLLDQLEKLTAAAKKEQSPGRDREVGNGPNTKLLARILALLLDEIPSNPGDARYRHGGALGGGHREWFRGKTGNGRYRLFYRFDSRARIIVYAWLNDAESLRTAGARSDAYAVFARMLDVGNPPEAWSELLAAATNDTALDRTKAVIDRAGRTGGSRPRRR